MDLMQSHWPAEWLPTFSFSLAPLTTLLLVTYLIPTLIQVITGEGQIHTMQQEIICDDHCINMIQRLFCRTKLSRTKLAETKFCRNLPTWPPKAGPWA